MARVKSCFGSMKKMRVVSLVLAVCSLALALSSCGSDTLTVNSKNFETLEAAEISLRCFEGPNIWDTVEVYDGTRFAIKERDGVIYLEEWEEKFSHWAHSYYRYLVGVDMGEFDGWVLMCYDTLNEDKTDILTQDKRIITENCLGFLNDMYQYEYEGELYWTADYNVVYIFTGLAHLGSDCGAIYKFSATGKEFDDYECELFADLGSCPNAFMMDGRNIVVATHTKGLLTIDPDGNVTELFTADYWSHLIPNSIVKLDNSYYVGTAYGILKYNIDTDDVVWYPYYNIEEE